MVSAHGYTVSYAPSAATRLLTSAADSHQSTAGTTIGFRWYERLFYETCRGCEALFLTSQQGYEWLTMCSLCCSRDEQQYEANLREVAAQHSLLGSVWRSATGSAGTTDTARLLPASAVSFVILVAAVAALWQRRALLRRKPREFRSGRDCSRDAGSRDHSSHQHGRPNGIVSVPDIRSLPVDIRSLLSRKQSA